MDRERLLEELDTHFGGTERVQRAVSRQAGDLSDSGRIETDMDYSLTVEAVITNLEDAPDEYSLVERWNWWIGSLELAFGNYERFRVRTDLEDTSH